MHVVGAVFWFTVAFFPIRKAWHFPTNPWVDDTLPRRKSDAR